MTPFKDSPAGQTHFVGDECDPPHHPIVTVKMLNDLAAAIERLEERFANHTHGYLNKNGDIMKPVINGTLFVDTEKPWIGTQPPTNTAP